MAEAATAQQQAQAHQPRPSNLRIPATLQAVFLASNRGNNVNRAPPEKVASKTFFRNWFFQRKPGSNGRRGFWASKEKNKIEIDAQKELDSALQEAKVRESNR